MTVREIVDECDRRSIRILYYGDFEVRLYLREDAESPVPEWLESAARERALEDREVLAQDLQLGEETVHQTAAAFRKRS